MSTINQINICVTTSVRVLLQLLNGLGLLKIKKTCKFIKFDIANFCPSMSAELLEKSINFAKSIIKIEDKIIGIIIHARKSLLFHDDNAWLKKEGNPLFDVTMGNFNGQRFASLLDFICQANPRLWLIQKTLGFIGMTA